MPLFPFLLILARSFFVPRLELMAEILALRQQLAILIRATKPSAILYITASWGDYIQKKRPTRNLSPAGLSLCKFCNPRYRLSSTAARASSADVPF
jgi:hypothetical protein